MFKNKTWFIRFVLKMIPKSERYNRLIFRGKRLLYLQGEYLYFNAHPYELHKD